MGCARTVKFERGGGEAQGGGSPWSNSCRGRGPRRGSGPPQRAIEIPRSVRTCARHLGGLVSRASSRGLATATTVASTPAAATSSPMCPAPREERELVNGRAFSTRDPAACGLAMQAAALGKALALRTRIEVHLEHRDRVLGGSEWDGTGRTSTRKATLLGKGRAQATMR